MFWGTLLVVLGAVLIFLGYLLLKRKIKHKKEEDIVAYYLDLAYHFPETLYLTIAGIITMVIGAVVAAC